MAIADLVAGVAVTALCAGAVLVIVESLWLPRCDNCGTRAVADDAEAPAPGLPVVIIVYRCPDCHRIVHRRCLGAWD